MVLAHKSGRGGGIFAPPPPPTTTGKSNAFKVKPPPILPSLCPSLYKPYLRSWAYWQTFSPKLGSPLL